MGESPTPRLCSADPDQRKLTLIYVYLFGERTVGHGVAVFKAA